jgi:hypothetical protein
MRAFAVLTPVPTLSFDKQAARELAKFIGQYALVMFVLSGVRRAETESFPKPSGAGPISADRYIPTKHVRPSLSAMNEAHHGRTKWLRDFCF